MHAVKRFFLLLLCATCSPVVCPDSSLMEDDVPSAFKHLFALQEGPVTIDLYGEELILNGESQFRTVILDRAGEQSLDRFLESRGVLPEARAEIIEALMRGIESSSACQGLVSDCALYPEQFDFVYNEKTRRLRVFINEEQIDFDRNKQFYTVDHNAVALVNQSSVYVQKSKTSFTGDWQNDTSLSLPLGYLRANTTLTLSDIDRRFEFYDANYVIDRNGYSLSAGFQTLPPVENSAYALTRSQDASAFHGTLFSNRRLQDRINNRFGDLSIFMPESTDIEILRDGEVLYRGVMPQGLNKISLATFPLGSYNVDIIFRAGGQVVKQEMRYVYNVPVFNMAKGDYDWLATAGHLRDNDFGEFYFGKAAASGRFLDTMLTGLGYTNVGGASVFSGYVEFIPGSYLRSSLTATAGLDGSAFLAGSVNLFQIYVNGEWMHSNSDKFRSLYNSASFRLISAGWSFDLLGSYFSLSYNEYRTDGDPGEGSINSRSVFLNGSKNFPWFQLSGTVQYDLKPPGGGNTDSKGNWFASLNLEIPFDYLSVASNYSYASSGLGNWRNTLRGRAQLGQQANVSAEVTVSTETGDNLSDSIGDQKRVEPSGLLMANYGNAYFATNGSLFLDQLSSYNGSITLQSTQLIDSSTFRFTADSGTESYLLLSNVSAADGSALELEDGTSVGHLELRNKSMDGMVVANLDRPSQVVPLDDYCQYQIRINQRGSRFVATDEVNVDYFSKPGTFVNVLNRVAEVDQYIVSFVSDQGLVTDLRCTGPGCAGLTSVTKGVYRLSLFAQRNFQLYAGRDICLLAEKEVVHREEAVNLGRSVCLSRDTIRQLLAGVPDNYRLYYLGVSKSVDEKLTSNVSYVRVGNVYARFLSARDASSWQGDVVPRAVSLPTEAKTRVKARTRR